MPVRAQRRRSVRTTRAFSGPRPMYSTPSSPSKLFRYCCVTSSLRWCFEKLTSLTRASSANRSTAAKNAVVFGATVAVDAKR